MTIWNRAVLTASAVLLIYWLIEVRLLLVGSPLIAERWRARRFR
jgi:hypothetical protein